MALHPTHAATLSRADIAYIQHVFTRLPRYWQKKRWLSASNRYYKDCVNILDCDHRSHNPPANRNLSEYIAASAVIHCMDGWGYLGRAINTSLLGDPNTTRHLGYYAELRAAMALLAASGIGVFNKQNYVIDSSGTSFYIGSVGTHAFAWDALETWANLPSTCNVLFNIIRPGGTPLEIWLNSFGMSHTLQCFLANQWLHEWGLDLQRLRDDKDARNESSYRPIFSSENNLIYSKEALDLTADLWNLSEPSGSIRFPVLDRYLLRRTLYKVFQVTHPSRHTHKRSPVKYKNDIDRMFHAMATTEYPRDLSEEKWKDFLVGKHNVNDPQLLNYASKTNDWHHKYHHFEVLSRAFLLLRIASGVTELLINKVPGFSHRSTQFWWEALAKTRAIWDYDQEVENFSDLWNDTSDALSQITEWRNELKKSNVNETFFKLWKEHPHDAFILSTCERIGLWGLGL